MLVVGDDEVELGSGAGPEIPQCVRPSGHPQQPHPGNGVSGNIIRWLFLSNFDQTVTITEPGIEVYMQVDPTASTPR